MVTSPECDPGTYQRSAAVYDVMNAARGKSYADEVATLLRLVRVRVGDAASLLDGRHDAVEQWIEPHRVALWSDAQYRDAFAAAGLDVEHDADGLIGRGLYLGRRPRD